MTDEILERAKKIKAEIENLEQRYETVTKVLEGIQKGNLYKPSLLQNGNKILTLTFLNPSLLAHLERGNIEQQISNLENEFNNLK